jgi:hypothetical protein
VKLPSNRIQPAQNRAPPQVLGKLKRCAGSAIRVPHQGRRQSPPSPTMDGFRPRSNGSRHAAKLHPWPFSLFHPHIAHRAEGETA